MSPEHEGDGEILRDKPKPVRHPVTMVITLTPDGDMKIECSQLRNQMYMLGFIEQAKLAIIQFNAMETMKKNKEKQSNILTIDKLMRG